MSHNFIIVKYIFKLSSMSHHEARSYQKQKYSVYKINTVKSNNKFHLECLIDLQGNCLCLYNEHNKDINR